MSRIELASGKFMDLLSPRHGDVELDDIASSLSRQCRFTGHTRVFYSVAEHAVLVARYLQYMDCRPSTVLLGLHHDDQEAYIGDLSTPLKAVIGPAYREIEAGVVYAIRQGLELPPADVDAERMVKMADAWALRLEARELLPSRGSRLGAPGETPDYLLPQGLEPDDAAADFVAMHHTLLEDIR